MQCSTVHHGCDEVICLTAFRRKQTRGINDTFWPETLIVVHVCDSCQRSRVQHGDDCTWKLSRCSFIEKSMTRDCGLRSDYISIPLANCESSVYKWIYWYEPWGIWGRGKCSSLEVARAHQLPLSCTAHAVRLLWKKSGEAMSKSCLPLQCWVIVWYTCDVTFDEHRAEACNMNNITNTVTRLSRGKSHCTSFKVHKSISHMCSISLRCQPRMCEYCRRCCKGQLHFRRSADHLLRCQTGFPDLHW
jgi:hypothetical protein